MHATGMVGSFPFLHLGLPQVLLPRFSAAAVIEAVRTHKVTTIFAVPGMLTRIADEIDGTGEPDPRWGQAVTAYVVSADASLQTRLHDLLRQSLAPTRFRRSCMSSISSRPPRP